MLIFTQIITFCSIYIFNIIFIYYSSKILTTKNKLIYTLFPLITSVMSMLIISKGSFTIYGYFKIFIVQLILFKIIYENDVFEILLIILPQIFNLILSRDIIVGILSILMEKSMNQILSIDNLYMLSFGLSRILMIISTCNFSRIHSIKEVNSLILNKKRLIKSTCASLSLFIILINSNHTYYYIGDLSQTTIYIMLINRLCIGFCYYFIVSMKFKLIHIIEEEVFYKSILLNLEHSKDLNIKMKEYSNKLKIYNHDFRHLLFNINDLIDSGELKKAKTLITNFDKNITNIETNNMQLSNNEIINVLLKRISSECTSKKINVDIECHIPSNLPIKELELITIFNNLCYNALEACEKQADNENKWIRIKSYSKNDDFIIYQNNSFNGDIKLKGDKLITSKLDKKNHGIGVESIKHIVSSANGIPLIKIDEENNIFNFLIKIPLN